MATFLSKVADKLGVGEDELNTAIKDAGLEMIDEAVAEGRLTEEQAERLRERVEEGGIPFPPRPHHGGPHLGRGPVLIADAAAQVLDMEKEELIEARQDGQSLVQIAESKGVSAEEFTAALLEEVQVQLDALVDEGKLTQEQADRIFQGIEEHIDRIVNAQPKPHGPGPGGHGPGDMGGPGFGPFGDKLEAEPSGVTP